MPLSSAPHCTLSAQGIDKVLFGHEWRHALQAYIVEPPLCGHGAGPSTLEYDKEGQTASAVVVGLRRALAAARTLLRRRGRAALAASPT